MVVLLFGDGGCHQLSVDEQELQAAVLNGDAHSYQIAVVGVGFAYYLARFGPVLQQVVAVGVSFGIYQIKLVEDFQLSVISLHAWNQDVCQAMLGWHFELQQAA